MLSEFCFIFILILNISVSVKVILSGFYLRLCFDNNLLPSFVY